MKTYGIFFYFTNLKGTHLHIYTIFMLLTNIPVRGEYLQYTVDQTFKHIMISVVTFIQMLEQIYINDMVCNT